MNALAQARALAEDTGARLTAIFVVDIAYELRDSALLASIDVEEIARQAERDARRRLAAAVGHGAHTIEGVVTSGLAPAAILERAMRDETDLIVMGVHGRGALDLRLFGSTTHQVIRRAPCPVLVIRS